MSGLRQYMTNINFTPFRLRVFQSENFSIQTEQTVNNNHKEIRPNVNKLYKSLDKNKITIKNPTQNFLYDKININSLSNSNILLDRSLQNELNTQNYNTFYPDNSNNNNSKILASSGQNFYNKNRFKNNLQKLFNNNQYYLDSNEDNFKPNSYRPKNPLSIKKNVKNPKNRLTYNRKGSGITIYMETSKNKTSNYFFVKNKKKDEELRKIIVIQSFWRGHFLRKLVVGGLEKYYSSIAMGKYLEKIYHNNIDFLFNYFLTLLNEFILKKKYFHFKCKKNSNHINIYFKKSKDTSNGLEIPSEKRRDCIYFFIKGEPKLEDNNLHKKQKGKINGTIYNKKLNKLKNQLKFFGTNINKDKEDSLIINRLKNTKSSNFPKKIIFTNKNKINKNIRILKEKNQKIYVKKKPEEDAYNKILFNDDNKVSNNDNKENNNDLNNINSIINIIRNKFFYLYFPLLINNLKIPINNIKKEDFIYKIIDIINKKNIQKFFEILKSPKNEKQEKEEIICNTLFKNQNNHTIIYYKKKSNNGKLNPKLENNNSTTNSKKLELLKKIIEKTTSINNESIKKMFSLWKNLPPTPIIVEPLALNPILKNYKDMKKDIIKEKIKRSQSSKKHIKIKLNRAFTDNGSVCSRSEKSNFYTLSAKKMKITKRSCDKSDFYTARSHDINFSRETNFCWKVVNLIKNIERKNIMYKSFIFWKKETKKENGNEK